jgi:hypothetical protein
MRGKKLFFLITAMAVLQCCTTADNKNYNSTPPIKEETGLPNSSEKTLATGKKHYVSISPYSMLIEAKAKTYFKLFIKNLGDEPIQISSYNVLVVFEGNTPEWANKKIDIQTYNELVEETRKDFENKIKKLGFISENIRNNVADMGPGAGASAFDSINNELERIRNKRDSDREFIEKSVMKPQTIEPEQRGGGVLVCDTTDMDHTVEGNFRIAVSIDGEVYRFTINRSFYK